MIADQEQFGRPILSTQLLESLIRFYGNSLQGFLSTYLEKSVETFMRQQEVVQSQLARMMTSAPLSAMSELTRHNLELLRRLMELTVLGRPIVIGTSRKRFVAQVTGEGSDDPSQRLFGTAASVAWSLANGASVVRVHDVGPMRAVVRMIGAILGR